MGSSSSLITNVVMTLSYTSQRIGATLITCAIVRQLSVLLSHKKKADYLQIRLLKSPYLINNAALIHKFERVLSVHYRKEFSDMSVKYFITLHTKSFTANHII